MCAAVEVRSAHHIESGTVLGGGRYVVVREINRGGLAVVYEAIDTGNNGAGVALKCMDLRPLTSSSAAVTGRAHVEREIRNASSFHHPNIINLLNVFADGNHLVIVLELVRGKDLLEMINERGGFLKDPTARTYFTQLLAGVEFLHRKGFAHRDIKPENCMVETRCDRLVIIDFGLSKHLTSAKTLGVGTPDYMAPEVRLAILFSGRVCSSLLLRLEVFGASVPVILSFHLSSLTPSAVVLPPTVKKLASLAMSRSPLIYVLIADSNTGASANQIVRCGEGGRMEHGRDALLDGVRRLPLRRHEQPSRCVRDAPERLLRKLQTGS